MASNRHGNAEGKNLQKAAKEDETLLSTSVPLVMKETNADGIFKWVVTLASLVNQCILCGVIQSFGVLYVDLLDYYGRKRGETAWIGSIVQGFFGFTAPVSEVLIKKYGCRVTTITGALLAASGLIASSFVSRMEYLYVTHGLVTGSGLGLMFLPSLVVLFQYMTKHRSLALGLSSAGFGIGALVFAILLQALLDGYGIKGTFLIAGSITLNAVLAGALFRPVTKLPSSEPTLDSVPTNTKVDFWCRARNYFIFPSINVYVVLIADFLSNMVGYVPFAHLPKLSRDCNLSESEVASLIPLMSVANIAGRLFFGWMGDFKSVNVVTLWSCSLAICGISLMLCPLLKTFILLGCFAVVYGIFIGVWGGLKPMALAAVGGTENVGKALGLSLFFGGFSAMSGSPLVGWLYDLTGSYNVPFYIGGAVLVFSGSAVLSHRGINKFCEYCMVRRNSEMNCQYCRSHPASAQHV